MHARIKGRVHYMHLAWGAAWLLGNGLLFLNKGPKDHVYVNLPDWLPLTVLLVLLVFAGVLTFVLGMKAINGASTLAAQQTKLYGAAWLFGFLGLILTIGKLTSGLPSDTVGLLWGATTTGLVGTLQIAGSAIWADRAQLRMGIWITVLNIVAAMAGYGWQSLIIAIAGGGVSLALGISGLIRAQRTPALVPAEA